MTVVLEPAGGLFATLTLPAPHGVQVLTPWDANAEPRPVAVGDLDGVETVRRRVYWQWQEDPSWLSQDGETPGLAEIIGLGLNSVTAEHYQIDQLRWLETASGSTLDEIGAVVGLPRNGLEDGIYRQAIKARGASLVGDAGIDAVMRPAKILLGETAVTYAPAYPRAFCWVVNIALSVDLLELVVSLLEVSVAGCGIGAKILLSPPDLPGWDWTTPQAWASSWSSAYGATDLATVAPWGWSVSVG